VRPCEKAAISVGAALPPHLLLLPSKAFVWSNASKLNREIRRFAEQGEHRIDLKCGRRKAQPDLPMQSEWNSEFLRLSHFFITVFVLGHEDDCT
jgi:hypothetical protein